MRRSGQRLLAIVGFYLIAVALVTYRQNWTPSAESRSEPDQPSNDAYNTESVGDVALIQLRKKETQARGKESAGRGADASKQPYYRIVGETDATLSLFVPNGTSKGFEGEPKIILFWATNEFSQIHLNGCPDWNCRIIVNNKSAANRSHAIVFHGGTYDSPLVRHPSQYYVFFTQESPNHASAAAPYADFYNLTLGYRRDADAPCPYGYSIQRRNPLATDAEAKSFFNATLAKKKKVAAWFVSNCGAPSERLRYVRELQKYMTVDVYGGCGTLQCPKGEACTKMLESDYKFYFAFENSICKDYMTEKFWERMTNDVVVVVLKRAVVEKYVPPKSFIAVDDFASPKLLAEYLMKLDSNDDLYLEYLKWKLNYKAIYLNGAVHDVLERPWGFCRLCSLLWQKPLPKKTYNNLQQWWSKEEVCDNGMVNRILTPSVI